MKRKSIISLLLLCMTVGMFTTSCQDMLSPNSERHAYEVAEDSLYSYWGILKSLQNVAERYVILNECRADLVDGSGYVSDTIAALMNFGLQYPEKYKDGSCAYLRVTDYYHIINSCNAYLAMCDTTTTTGTNRKYMIKEYAQVKSIRAWVYLQLVYAYGEVPFYTKPMLTTDEINNFIDDPNHATVKASNIADKLAADLEPMAAVEEMYGFPEYNNYGDVSSGNSHFVCHSSKCMFPVNVVMGDLYLLQGQATQSEATCAKAAQHYYDFINTKYCGPISTLEYSCTGDLDATKDYPLYGKLTGNPYNEPSAMSRQYETITVIPSNSGKLEGKVNTDINRLFGFEAEMFTSGGESAAAGIALNRQYERQLLPSKGYELIAGAQNYEIYEGVRENNNLKEITGINILPGVGDARQAWIYGTEGRQWNFQVGDDVLYGKMVSKQNPSGIYSNAYPVIYRKSTIWLRFAEALNRAGYPSYAFAILKTGLCSHTAWFPHVPSTPYIQKLNTFNNSSSLYDYKIKEALYAYALRNGDDPLSVFIPADDETLLKMTSVEALKEYVEAYFEQQYEESKDADGNPTITKGEYNEANVYYIPKDENSFSNEPILDPEADAPYACHYIDLRELKRADHVKFLNFNQPYLRGINSSYAVYYKQPGKLLNQSPLRATYSGTDDDTYTIGIHQRGCGFIQPWDPAKGRSSYQYVDMVAKKIKENTGAEVTATDIYGGAIDDDVRDAVEDLIIDEMALELAFEGTRFSDLCRVAQRRGTDYLAKRVSMRGGVESGSLRSALQNEKNWYLPFPQK